MLMEAMTLVGDISYKSELCLHQSMQTLAWSTMKSHFIILLNSITISTSSNT